MSLGRLGFNSSSPTPMRLVETTQAFSSPPLSPGRFDAMNDGWVVTGAGLITALGNTPEALHQGLGRGIRPLRAQPPETSPSHSRGGDLLSIPIEGFDMKDHVARRGL